MVVKQSSLDKRWYYRIGKVILLVLPWVVLAILITKGTIHIPEITKKNILDVLEKNLRYIGGTIIGYILYIAVLDGLRRLVCYIGRGGYENDTIKIPKSVKLGHINPAIQPTKTNSDAGVFVPLIIVFLLLIWMFAYQGSNKQSSTSTVTNNATKVHKYCNPGHTYNYSSRMCCPNSSPHYFNGGYGYAAGCYQECPYGNECGTLTSTY